MRIKLLLLMAMFALSICGQDIKELTNKANNGDAKAQNDLGYKYLNGIDLAKDDNQAFYWFKKSAEQGYVTGQDNLGWCYLNGRGVERNFDQAFYWFKKSAESGSAFAQRHLGIMYVEGDGVTQDFQQAFAWYMKSALNGDLESQARVGYMYATGTGVEVDLEQSISWTTKAAEHGNGFAQATLATCYLTGTGVLKDYEQGYEWALKSTNQGNTSGKNVMGMIYERGLGVNQDYGQAFNWFWKSAEQGDTGGLRLLGRCFFIGEGVPVDYAKAAVLFTESAKNDKTGRSLAYLGHCYEYGYGVEKDTNKAYECYYEAVCRGVHSYGAVGMGSCYEHGYGVEKNDTLAIVCYQKAIDIGNEYDFLGDWHDVKLRLKNLQAMNTGNYYGVQPSQLPILDYVTGSLAFVDNTGSNAIGANGQYVLRLQVKNTGKGIAKGCKVKVSKKGSTNGISVKNLELPDIAIGATQTIEVPVVTDVNTVNGQVEFALQVDEPNGFGTDPQYITVKTRVYEAPLLQITDYSLTSDGGQVLKRKVPFDLQLMLQNTKSGLGEDVSVSISIPANVLLVEGKEKMQFATIKGGEAKSLVYSLIVNNNYLATTIPIKVHIDEKYGKYGVDRIVTLELDQSMASSKISIEAAQREQREIALAKINADVDVNIPKNSQLRQNTFAVIITNEHYDQVAPVPYAQRDGEVFAAYCRNTLGIPQQNIRSYADATYGKMLSAIKDIQGIAYAYGGDINVIFYYAGHGVPSESTKDAYLLPVDADGKQMDVCYSIGKLYKDLCSLNAKSVVVFMDACFSGSLRGDGMLASARGVKLRAKADAPQGNMVVFSAAQGDETAYPYKEKGHGMFTYFLLKKLQESKGDCTLGELGEYILTNVRQQAVVVNRKSQTPTVVPSAGISDKWRTMKLK